MLVVCTAQDSPDPRVWYALAWIGSARSEAEDPRHHLVTYPSIDVGDDSFLCFAAGATLPKARGIGSVVHLPTE